MIAILSQPRYEPKLHRKLTLDLEAIVRSETNRSIGGLEEHSKQVLECATAAMVQKIQAMLLGALPDQHGDEATVLRYLFDRDYFERYINT